MGLYEIETTGGVYQIETEDAPTPGVVDSLTGGRGFIGDSVGPLMTLGNALTFNTMDEIVAGGSAGLDSVKALFGGNGTTSFSDNYANRKNQVDTILNDYRERSPVGSTIMSLAGGVKMAGQVPSSVGAKTGIIGKGVQGAKEGAVIGGAYGLGEGNTIEDRLGNAKSGAAFGGLFGGAAAGGGEAVSKLFSGASKAAKSQADKLKLSAYGANKTAIRKANKKIPDLLDEAGDYTNPIGKAIDDFVSDGGAKNGFGAEDLLGGVQSQLDDYSTRLNSALQTASKQQDDIIVPAFTKTKDYVGKSVAGANKDAAEKKAAQIINDTINNTDGTLISLHEEKMRVGNLIAESSWGTDNAGMIERNILKRVYADLRDSIEKGYTKVTGDSKTVKDLNSKIGQRLNLKGLFADKLATEMSQDVMKKAVGGIRTSGGFGVPLISGAGALAGGVTGGGLGALAGAGLGYAANTPAGKKAISDALSSAILNKGLLGLSSAGRAVSGNTSALVGGLESSLSPHSPYQSSLQVQPSFQSERSQTDMQSPQQQQVQRQLSQTRLPSQEAYTQPTSAPSTQGQSSGSSYQDPLSDAFNRIKNTETLGANQMDIKTSPQGIELIKQMEGKRLKPYKDTGGVLTVGYGHTKNANREITDAEAEQLLVEDVARAEADVDALVKVPLSQSQYDALVSFAYNVGGSQLAKSTLIKKLNAGDYEGAAKEFSRWVHDDGKKVSGLVKRRAEEAKMFMSGLRQV